MRTVVVYDVGPYWFSHEWACLAGDGPRQPLEFCGRPRSHTALAFFAGLAEAVNSLQFAVCKELTDAFAAGRMRASRPCRL